MLTQVIAQSQTSEKGGRGTKQPPLPALTGLRFFAALIVVFFHYSYLLEYPPGLQQIFGQGRVGVSFFFLLSGFILSYNYYDWFKIDTARWLTFARLRFARVFPMYALALVVITPITLYFWQSHLVIVQPFYSEKLTNGGLALSWLANLFTVQVYVPIDTFQNLWNLPAWSIGAEFFFYACFPWFIRYGLSWIKQVRGLWRLAAVLFAIESLLFGVVAGYIFLNFKGQQLENYLEWFTYRLPFMRVWEFMLGCTVGAIFLRVHGQPQAYYLGRVLDNPKLRQRWLFGVLVLLLVVALAKLPGGLLGTFLGCLRWYVVYTPLFVALILLVAWGPSLVTRWLQQRWLVLLGEASYSLYIIHWILYIILFYKFQLNHQFLTYWYWLAIVATVAASVVCYKLVELPARSWLRPKH